MGGNGWVVVCGVGAGDAGDDGDAGGWLGDVGCWMCSAGCCMRAAACDLAEEVGGEAGNAEVDAVLESGTREEEGAVWRLGAGLADPPAQMWLLPLGYVELVDLQLRLSKVAASLENIAFL